MRFRARGVQNHQIDVGKRRHVATTVSTVGYQRDLRAELFRSVRPQVRQSGLVKIQQDPVQQLGKVRGDLDTRRAGLVLGADFLAAGQQSLARGQQRFAKNGISRHGGLERKMQWRAWKLTCERSVVKVRVCRCVSPAVKSQVRRFRPSECEPCFAAPRRRSCHRRSDRSGPCAEWCLPRLAGSRRARRSRS